MDKNQISSLSPMHIALFIRSFGGSGGARFMVNLARALLDKGHRVDLVMGRAQGYYMDEIPAKVRIVDLGVHSSLQALGSLTRVHGDGMALAKMVLAPKSHWVLGAIPGLANYLVREQPQAMIAAMDYPNIAAILARDRSRITTKLIITAHIDLSTKVANNQKKHRIRVFPKVAHRFYPKADAVVGVSKGVVKDLIKTINLPPDRITTIYNPVISPEIKDRAMEYACDWFNPGSPPVMLAVGKLMPAKDFPTLLRAFARVRRMMEARLIILGEGEQRGKLLKQAEDLGICDDLSMPGFVENPFSYMSKASVYVMSSAWEGLPTVLIEALACGCPVVSTNCPSGPAEILENGRFGALVPVGDDAALAEAIIDYIKNPPDKNILMSRGQEFSLEHAAEEYIGLIKRL
jgi:glycosyltransferase involved in cell wall biosynthesis